MHFPTAKATKSLRHFIHDRFADAAYASAEEGVLAVSSLLDAQSAITLDADQATYNRLLEILQNGSALLSLAQKAPLLEKQTEDLRLKIKNLNLNQRREFLDVQEQAILNELEELINALSAEHTLNAAVLHKVSFEIVDWDFARINRHMSSPDESSITASDEITREKLEDYLKCRFHDPDLEVTQFAKGGGGFGKQTLFFESTGKLSGEFVLRRDRATALVDNDCHRVVNEFAVIQAVRGTGFPAPDALWLETGSPMLPGPNFFVMRRSAGKVQGTVFGGTGVLSQGIVSSFAQTVGRLHRLEPLTCLGNLNESINDELWGLTIPEVVERYIAGYYKYFMKSRASQVPSLIAVYRWLFANVPEAKDAPGLVHGDLGLQNLLFQGESLQVVVDWEMAHIGDPMEDIAYIRNTANTSLDWDAFVAGYESTSGKKVDLERVRFYQIWCQARNATAAVLSADRYSSGESSDIALAHLGFTYYSAWLGEAIRLINEH